MMLGQTLSQSQTQTMQMGGQMLHSLSILGMSSEDLAEHLKEQAAKNPYISYAPPRAFLASGAADFDAAAALAADKPSLLAFVIEQIELAFPASADRMIALHFAEALEPTGWLGQDLETLALVAGVPVAKAAGILSVLQGFEPSGLFARSLAECLMIQAREAQMLTWEVETLLNNLDLVASRNFAELAERCDCEPSDIPDILAQIRGFDPKPGLAFSHQATPVFPPDLIAARGAKGWDVELNKETTCTITVLEDRQPGGDVDKEARALRRKALADARALSAALQRRGSTLLRAAAVLVARQSAFLDHGPAQLVPLTLEDVAGELGLHASTVSRAVSGRMIQTPTRTLPLRAFFSRSVMATGDGEAVSRNTALDLVQKAVADEDKSNPLSDDAIVDLAAEAGLRIARRTVAKYRSTLGIASSYRRKRQHAAG